MTAVVGLVVGADTAFRWSLYLLWCLWPVAVYASARLFGTRPLAAALAAAVAPLLASAPRVGYEQHAYVWNGYGIWSQLWASWALPFAWALSWRAMTDKRFLAPAAALVALTAAFHFETGYLAFAAIVIFPWLVRRDLWHRAARAGVLLVTSMLASAWVWLPLAALCQVGRGQPGTGRDATGERLRRPPGPRLAGDREGVRQRPPAGDQPAGGGRAAGRPGRVAGGRPGQGVCRAVWSWGCCCRLAAPPSASSPASSPAARTCSSAASSWAVSSRGSTWQGWARPRSPSAARGWRQRRPCARRGLPWFGWVPAVLAVAAGVLYLSPAWRSLGRYDAANAANMGYQHAADTAESPELNTLLGYIRHHPDGRAYAGTPYNWGARFTIGFVPVFRYLASQDVDAIGFSLRTASLMSQPELHFDGSNLGDYALFGIRYLILPVWERPFAGAVPVLRAGQFRLLRLPGNSYIRVVDTVGSVTANRADIGSRTASYLRSPLPGEGRYLTVGFAGATPAPPTLPASPLPSSRTAPEPPAARLAAGVGPPPPPRVRSRHPGPCCVSRWIWPTAPPPPRSPPPGGRWWC